MKICVLFFGSVAASRSERQRDLDMAEETTLAELLAHLGIDMRMPMMLAVNQQIVRDLETTLEHRDEIAVMPMFSGG